MELLTASGAAIDGLRIAGLISMALGAGHVAFPRLFGWASAGTATGGSSEGWTAGGHPGY